MIKSVPENDYKKAIKLSEYAFQYTVSEEEIPKRIEKMKKHYILADYEGDFLTSKLHIIPFNIMLFGESMKMGGIAGVATWPEYRRKKKVADLISESLEWMRENNFPISFLHPFKISFYRQFGWELANTTKTHKFKREHLSFVKGIDGEVRRLSKKEALPIIQSLYDSHIRKLNGMLARDQDWWENSVYGEEDHIAVYYKDESPGGYMVYSVTDRKFKVEEAICISYEAKMGLWNFLCQHDSMIDEAEWMTYGEDNFVFALENPSPETSIRPFSMARIVDVEAFLQHIPFKSAEETAILHLSDPQAAWNNGIIVIREGKAEFHRKEQAGSICTHHPKRGVHLEIGTLTAMLLGYKSAQFLHETGRIKGAEADIKVLESAIPSGTSAMIDFF